MSPSVNLGNDYKGTYVDLGARRRAIIMFTAGYSVTTIQQLMKERDVIVMKRSLYLLINQFASQLLGTHNS